MVPRQRPGAPRSVRFQVHGVRWRQQLHIADLRGLQRSHFVAATVELLTTGVDVPSVRNIVFMKYVRSPISFY